MYLVRKHQPATRRQGFTIVELLIVIVVIGILAAITIVSYNGVVGKARNTQLLVAFDNYEQGLRLYKAQSPTNSYPDTIDTSVSAYPIYACLGPASSYPATASFSANACWENKSPASISGKVIPSVNDALKSAIGTLPTIDFETVPITSASAMRGIMFMKKADGTGALVYPGNGDGNCGRGTKTSAGGIYTCVVTLD